MRKSGFLTALLALALVSCGGDTDSTDDAFQPGTGGSGPAATVASLTLVTSSPTIPSDGATPAEITAFVRNASNQFMQNVPVTFSSSGGGLLVTQGSTDVNGVAKATLSALNDPTLRALTVTAIAGGVQSTVTVNVSGTVLSVQGPSALALQQTATYTVALRDAGNNGLSGRTVTVASARANTLTPASVTTDANGIATFTMRVVNSGNDTITVTGLGTTATQAVAVNADSFSFTSPAVTPVTEVALGAAQSLTVRWTSSGAPVVNATLSFSTTRGTVTPTAVTNASGDATVSISATNAGAAIVTASSGVNSAQLPLEFVATTPASIEVQPSIFTLATGQSSTITAVVRDAQGNLVKNQTVAFGLVDVTGGTLSVGSARTDSQGRAQTIYTASSSTSANEGVRITASVPGISQTVALTVARREVFISLGTGNEVAEPNPAQYRLDYIVQVTDSNGNGVANVPVSLRILSINYYKGNRVLLTAPATGWGTTYSTPAPGCADEDVNRNGFLDSGEDLNNSTRLEAGNIATVSPANATTDANGFVLIAVSYPQEFAYYLDVSLSASTTVQGTEYVRSANFMLPGSAPDFANAQNAPPGFVSSFGTGSCAAPN